MRPSDLAGDDSPHIPVLIHAVQWVASHDGTGPDYVLLLQPTVPLRSSDDIENCVRLILEKEAESVVSVCEAPSHPYLTKTIASDGRMGDFVETPEGYLPRQKMPPVYALNGAVYLVRRDVLVTSRRLITDHTYAYVMPPERSLDIDTPWDLYLADLILKDRAHDESR